jgi:hypothetical protein
MVRHDHKAVQVHPSKMRRNRNPILVRNPPERGEIDFALVKAPENASPFVRANRDEIRPGAE